MSKPNLVIIVLAAAGLMSVARAAQAQESVANPPSVPTYDFTPALMNASALSALHLDVVETDQTMLRPVVPVRPKMGGGALLSSLYASMVLTQALDTHSTLKALRAGGAEANPLMAGLARHPAAFVATKAAVAAVSVWAARRIASRNKVAAIVTMAAVNSVYAMAASRNYRLARR